MPTDHSIRRNARDRAMKALVLSYEGEVFCHDLLDTWQSSSDSLSPADAALAAELTIGVSRHRLTCEHIAARFYRGRWPGLSVPVRVILALGVYQLCWLDRVPDHAAVDQAVRQARRYGQGASSTVNAILRKVAQCRGHVIDCPAEPDPRRYLPLDARLGRLFEENIFPDPNRRPLDYLIAVTSHPSWLIERWHRRFKPKLCRQVCDAGLRRPPLALRPNPLRIDSEALRDRLIASGNQAALNEDGTAVIVHNAPSAAQLPEIQEGLCQPQDTTAQLPLRLSPPQPGDVVIDLCAGVGTKSTQAAELMNNRGTVIASDIDEKKLTSISANAERLGLTNIRPTPSDRLPTALSALSRPPDLILVDTPCLNTGVLARRPEARYRAGRQSLQEIVEIQRQILQHAHELSAPNTQILYSTCSLEEEENEQQAEWYCQTFPQWRISRQQFTLPNENHDGGFCAVLDGVSAHK